MATSTPTPAATNETTSPPGGVEVQQDARDKKRLYVSWAVTDQSLIAVAKAARPEAKVVEARALSGPARAFGFVTFATEEEAAAALAAMNGKTITTEPIQVDFAKISSGEKKARPARRTQNSARPKKKREPKAASGGNAPAGKKEPKPKKETPAKQAPAEGKTENGAPAKQPKGPKREKKEKPAKKEGDAQPAASTTTTSGPSTPAATTTPSSPAPAKTTPAPAKSPATTPATTTSSPAPAKTEKPKGSKGKKEAPKA